MDKKDKDMMDELSHIDDDSNNPFSKSFTNGDDILSIDNVIDHNDINSSGGVKNAVEDYESQNSQKIDYKKRELEYTESLSNLDLPLEKGNEKEYDEGRKSSSRMSGLDNANLDYQLKNSEKTDYNQRDVEYYESLDDNENLSVIENNDSKINITEQEKKLSFINDTNEKNLDIDVLNNEHKSLSRMSTTEEAQMQYDIEQSQRVDYEARNISNEDFDIEDANPFIFSDNPPYKKDQSNVITSDDITKQMTAILDSKKRAHTNVLTKVTNSEKRVLMDSVMMLSQQMSAGSENDVAVGINFARENVLPISTVISSSMRGAMATSMIDTLVKDMKFQNAFAKISGMKDSKGKPIFKVDNPSKMSLKDIQNISSGTQRLLKAAGITHLNGDPVQMRLQLQKAWVSGRLSKDQVEAIAYVSNRANKIAGVGNTSKVTVFRFGSHRLQIGAGKVAIFRFAKQKLLKSYRQDETFNAMYMTGRFTKQAISILSKVLRIAKYPLRLAKIATLKARTAALRGINAARRMAVQAAGTAVGQKIVNSGVGKAASKGLRGASRVTGKAASTVRTTQKTVRATARGTGRVLDRFGRIIRAPARVITAPFRAVRTIAQLPFKGRFNPLRAIFNFFGNIFSGAQLIKKAIIGVVLLYALLMLILLLGNMLIITLLGNFDFESKNDTVKEKCFDVISACYNEQLQTIMNYRDQYTSVTINTEDKKSNERYTAKEGLDYSETTNSTELLSMAIVYFQGDLDQFEPSLWDKLISGLGFEDSSKPSNPLEQYIQEMYYGSHVIDVNPDEDGTTAEITVTTYYFDDIFNCSRSTQLVVNDGGMGDGTGEMIKIKLKVNDAPRAACSAYADQGDSGNPPGTEPFNVECGDYHTVAFLGSGSWYKSQTNPPGGWHGNKYEGSHGTYVVINIPEENKGDAGIFGNVVFHVGSEGTGRGDRVFDLFFVQAQTYRNAGFGAPTLKTYIPDNNGTLTIDALVKDVCEDFKNIPGFVEMEEPPITGVAGADASKFLQCLATYNTYVKEHSSHNSNPHMHKDGNDYAKTFSQFKKNGRTACCAPLNWALVDMRIKTATSGNVWFGSGHWSSYSSALKARTTKITSGKVIGMTIGEAEKKKLLQPGDIIGVDASYAHTIAYLGGGKCYDGGGKAESKGYKNGIVVDYSHAGDKIGQIIRWKN